MSRSAIDAAGRLVATRFPAARQAWLGGSVVAGVPTPTSDLDIVVVLPDSEVYRTSLSFEGWPVELFVHTEPSLPEFVAKDRARRRPTMARLVATGVPLLTGIEAEDLWAHCVAAVDAGAEPLSPARPGPCPVLPDRSAAGPRRGRTFGRVGCGRRRDLAAVRRTAPGRERWVLAGDRVPLVAAADRVLTMVGGRLWDGFRLSAN